MKRMLMSLLIAAATAITFAPVTQAREDEPATLFKRLDADGDGKISLKEYQDAAKNRTAAEERFVAVDDNKDGQLSMDEWTVYIGKHPHTEMDPAKM